ncbi:MAG: peptidoglycan editing factor PgeF [Zoogloeaceae bacterium]|jgi:YfiH family protein|nr:peptidoglycan editing factor PgeF [Zoogloeaceae bacterium]
MVEPVFILPDWPAPPNVKSLQTTRKGGVSRAPYASFNLGQHVGDAPEAVARNRALLQTHLPALPVWMEQAHGVETLDLAAMPAADAALRPIPRADAAVCRVSGKVCAIMTADCLPVLFCDDAGEVVAAAHAGWRGLLAGVLENTIAAMRVAPERILVWLGPAIGPAAFEVGAEIRAAFIAHAPEAEAAFLPGMPGKYRANLCHLASQRLNALGVRRIFGGDCCTHTDKERFFSYRRDGRTGRMATLIYLA